MPAYISHLKSLEKAEKVPFQNCSKKKQEKGSEMAQKFGGTPERWKAGWFN